MEWLISLIVISSTNSDVSSNEPLWKEQIYYASGCLVDISTWLWSDQLTLCCDAKSHTNPNLRGYLEAYQIPRGKLCWYRKPIISNNFGTNPSCRRNFLLHSQFGILACSISQEICTQFLLCCALLWLYIDWFSHIHQAYFTGTVAIWRLPQCQQSNPDEYG